MKKRASGATGQMATVQDTVEDDLEVEEEEAIEEQLEEQQFGHILKWLASFICDQMEQYLTHLWLVYDRKGRRPIGWWVSAEMFCQN